MIGQRLRLSRASSGLSLRDLEAKIDNKVSAQAISKYEKDEMMPSSGVLLALAEALGVTVPYLMAPDEVVLEAVSFRTKDLPERDRARVEARVTDSLQRYLVIEDLLNVPSIEWERPREAPFPTTELIEADRAAHALRAHWQLGLDPIPNLAEFLEEKGIKVVITELPQDVDGVMCRVKWRERDILPVIVINEHRFVSGERERFTLAHELGHLVLDCRGDFDPEKAANRFAGAFLMPAEVLWSEVGKQRDCLSIGELIDLKVLFGVSLQMLVHRCHDLRIIKDDLYRQLFREFKDKGWRDPPYEEPQALQKEYPRRFRRLCMRALTENLISESKAAELLGKTVRELNKLLDEGAAELAH